MLDFPIGFFCEVGDYLISSVADKISNKKRPKQKQ